MRVAILSAVVSDDFYFYGVNLFLAPQNCLVPGCLCALHSSYGRSSIGRNHEVSPGRIILRLPVSRYIVSLNQKKNWNVNRNRLSLLEVAVKAVANELHRADVGLSGGGGKRYGGGQEMRSRSGNEKREEVTGNHQNSSLRAEPSVCLGQS